MNRARLAALAILASLALPPGAGAETVYVIDRLAVGVHEDQQLTSGIIKVLPTGTRLEVLRRDANLVQVETEDGIVGWVDGDYVMSDRPAQLVLFELEREHANTLTELEAARAEVESLRRKLDAMGSGTDPPESETSTMLRDMQRLAEENRRLKALIATTQASSDSPRPGPADRRPRSGWEGLSDWNWLMLGACLLLVFALGGYLVDFGVRRRHGGFRV